MPLKLNLITRFLPPADNIPLNHHTEQILVPQRLKLFGHKSVINEFSVLSNEHLNDIFGAMFLDSDDTVQQFSMGRTKSMHVRNHGLGPFLNWN